MKNVKLRLLGYTGKNQITYANVDKNVKKGQVISYNGENWEVVEG